MLSFMTDTAPIVPPRNVAAYLDANHYLGRTARGFAWSDEYGVIVLAPPTSRRLPREWLELSRWCLTGEPNAGSRQWAAVARYLRAEPTRRVDSRELQRPVSRPHRRALQGV
jgi:hypothetical protein